MILKLNRVAEEVMQSGEGRLAGEVSFISLKRPVLGGPNPIFEPESCVLSTSQVMRQLFILTFLPLKHDGVLPKTADQ